MRQAAVVERRRLLPLLAAGAGAFWLPRSGRSHPAWFANPFALGVASGSPSHDSVVLWTRLMAPRFAVEAGRHRLEQA